MSFNLLNQKLNSFINLGTRLGLDSIYALLAELGSPQDKLQVVHIGGTNGKGSTVCYLEYIALESRVKCGAYTSPALLTFRENIRVNNKWITKAQATEGLQIIFDACEKIVASGIAQPTQFEIETALAFWFFAKEQCDIVFLETGLGGALDATNVVKQPICVAFTNIDYDHMNEFGKSLKEIAEAEFGIIKKDVPTYLHVDQYIDFHHALEAQRIKVGGFNGPFVVHEKYSGKLRSSSVYAAYNAQMAKAISLMLGYSKKSIQNGLAKADWFGRFSIVANNPTIILDGAHNTPAIHSLISSLKKQYRKEKLVFIVGIYKDKDISGMLSAIGKVASKIITVSIDDVIRLQTAANLANIANKLCSSIVASSDMTHALDLAKASATKNDIIVICGSLSIVAAAAKELNLLGVDKWIN